MRVLARSLVLALALGAIPLASVAAHECIVSNRSATGDAGATNSARWVRVTLTDLYSQAHEHGFPALSAAQVAYAVDLAESQGVPSSFVWRSDKTIAGDAAGYLRNGRQADGRGMDHAFAIYGDRIIGALFAALSAA